MAVKVTTGNFGRSKSTGNVIRKKITITTRRPSKSGGSSGGSSPKKEPVVYGPFATGGTKRKSQVFTGKDAIKKSSEAFRQGKISQVVRKTNALSGKTSRNTPGAVGKVGNKFYTNLTKQEILNNKLSKNTKAKVVDGRTAQIQAQQRLRSGKGTSADIFTARGKKQINLGSKETLFLTQKQRQTRLAKDILEQTNTQIAAQIPKIVREINANASRAERLASVPASNSKVLRQLATTLESQIKIVEKWAASFQKRTSKLVASEQRRLKSVSNFVGKLELKTKKIENKLPSGVLRNTYGALSRRNNRVKAMIFDYTTQFNPIRTGKSLANVAEGVAFMGVSFSNNAKADIVKVIRGGRGKSNTLKLFEEQNKRLVSTLKNTYTDPETYLFAATGAAFGALSKAPTIRVQSVPRTGTKAAKQLVQGRKIVKVVDKNGKWHVIDSKGRVKKLTFNEAKVFKSKEKKGSKVSKEEVKARALDKKIVKRNKAEVTRQNKKKAAQKKSLKITTKAAKKEGLSVTDLRKLEVARINARFGDVKSKATILRLEKKGQLKLSKSKSKTVKKQVKSRAKTTKKKKSAAKKELKKFEPARITARQYLKENKIPLKVIKNFNDYVATTKRYYPALYERMLKTTRIFPDGRIKLGTNIPLGWTDGTRVFVMGPDMLRGAVRSITGKRYKGTAADVNSIIKHEAFHVYKKDSLAATHIVGKLPGKLRSAKLANKIDRAITPFQEARAILAEKRGPKIFRSDKLALKKKVKDLQEVKKDFDIIQRNLKRIAKKESQAKAKSDAKSRKLGFKDAAEQNRWSKLSKSRSRVDQAKARAIEKRAAKRLLTKKIQTNKKLTAGKKRIRQAQLNDALKRLETGELRVTRPVRKKRAKSRKKQPSKKGRPFAPLKRVEQKRSSVFTEKPVGASVVVQVAKKVSKSKPKKKVVVLNKPQTRSALTSNFLSAAISSPQYLVQIVSPQNGKPINVKTADLGKLRQLPTARLPFLIIAAPKTAIKAKSDVLQRIKPKSKTKTRPKQKVIQKPLKKTKKAVKQAQKPAQKQKKKVILKTPLKIKTPRKVIKRRRKSPVPAEKLKKSKKKPKKAKKTKKVKKKKKKKKVRKFTPTLGGIGKKATSKQRKKKRFVGTESRGR